MELRTLDHVALWVADRDTIADFATRHLGMHVIDRTERFTLVGSDARRGKLTLFVAEGPRNRGALEHVALGVNDLESALAELPAGLALERRRDGEVYFDVSEGLRLGLVERETGVDYDLDHVALWSADPEAALEGWIELGLGDAEPGPSGAPRAEVGGAYVELHAGGAGAEPERPLLNHLAVLVDAAAAAEDAGFDVADVVDAPNTFAVFVWGPDRVKLEYVEHKPSFSLS
jgi:catechol 2,3-dioxygenase-like lactoylglutathione lyase family enzyme